MALELFILRRLKTADIVSKLNNGIQHILSTGNELKKCTHLKRKYSLPGKLYRHMNA